MPKIVDHEAHSRDLARRAASYFSDHGYSGTSMRKIAAHLGVSKSALYHYFPTKEALFLACTRQVIGAQTDEPPTGDTADLATLTAAMRPGFGNEMALVFDYLRGRSAAEIASDEAMQLALASYRAAVARCVPGDQVDQALAQILGQLLLDHLSGQGAP